MLTTLDGAEAVDGRLPLLRGLHLPAHQRPRRPGEVEHWTISRTQPCNHRPRATSVSATSLPCWPLAWRSSAMLSWTCRSSGGRHLVHPHHNLLLTCSASATRNFVHSLSHLFEIMLLILLGNDTSRITRGNSEILPIFQSSAQVPQVLLLPRLSRWSASLRRWLPDSWRAWSPPPSWQGSPSLQSLQPWKQSTLFSVDATLGTIDTRWLAIVVLGGLRGPGTYGETQLFRLWLILYLASAWLGLCPQSRCGGRGRGLQREPLQIGHQHCHTLHSSVPRGPDTSRTGSRLCEEIICSRRYWLGLSEKRVSQIWPRADSSSWLPGILIAISAFPYSIYLHTYLCMSTGLPAKVSTQWLASLSAPTTTTSFAPSSTLNIASTGSLKMLLWLLPILTLLNR